MTPLKPLPLRVMVPGEKTDTCDGVSVVITGVVGTTVKQLRVDAKLVISEIALGLNSVTEPHPPLLEHMM